LNDTVNNEDAALQGARDIIAEWINENILFVNNCDACTRVKQPLHKVVKPKKTKALKNSTNILIGQNR
jgi:uncharacterized protein